MSSTQTLTNGQILANRLCAYASSGGAMDDHCRSDMRQAASHLRSCAVANGSSQGTLPELPTPAVPSEPIHEAPGYRSAQRGEYEHIGDSPDYFTADQMRDYARAALAATQLCACKDRPASECDEQWGPKCDMGNNPKFARVVAAQPAEPTGLGPQEITESLMMNQAGKLATQLRAMESNYADGHQWDALDGNVVVKAAIALEGFARIASIPAPAAQQGVPVAEIAKEPDYWNRGHFHTGHRHQLHALLDLSTVPIGTKLYAAAPKEQQ